MSALLESLCGAARRAECMRNDLALDLQVFADQVKARHAVQKLHAAAPAPVALPTLAQYHAALAAHDWHFEHSDDHRAWCAGRDSLVRIRAMREQIDPAGVVFEEYARGVTA